MEAPAEDEILDKNPIRLLDLNRYPLTEEQTKDPELVQWTKEIIKTFTSDLRMYPEFRKTVNPFVYLLPSSTKLSKYGARHFVMAGQCALTKEEIKKLRAEAPNKYSPYWYGMISTCHHSGHITLKLARMLFPGVNWHIVQTLGHTFVTNMSVDNIANTFSNNSFLSKSINTEKLSTPRKERIQEFVSIMGRYMIDKAEFDPSAPMIFDILATDKEMFLGLVSRTSKRYITMTNSPTEFRQELVNVGNIRTRKRKALRRRSGSRRNQTMRRRR
jgi:hypothetical protein